MPGDLPKGWVSARFRDAMRLEERREPIDPAQTYKLLGVRWYGNGAFLREERLGEGLSAQHIYRVKAGDVIYNRLFAWKGSFGLIGEDLAGCYVSNEFPLFAARLDRVDPHFLLWILQHPRTAERADVFSTGTTSISRNRLSEDDFLRFPVNLPSLPEQRAISDVLAAAEDVIGGTETTIRLLKSASRALLIQNISQFGHGATVTSIGSILDGGPKSGFSPVCRDLPPGVGVLKLSAITGGQLNWESNVKFAELPQTTATQFQLRSGDFLVVRGSGSKDIVGSGSLVSRENLPPFPCIFPDLVIRLRADRAKALPEFFSMMWDTHIIRDQIRKSAKSTNGIWKINQTDIREFRLPLPSLEVQAALVQLIGGLHQRISAEQQTLASLYSTRIALAQELLSGRLRLPQSIIARYHDVPAAAA